MRCGSALAATAFNSIIQLEHERGIPRNPFINAGAIVVADVLLAGHQPREAIGDIVQFVRFLANDETIAIDPAVARSEIEFGDRNRALASYTRAIRKLAASSGPDPRGLLPPLRHRHELLPAVRGRVVPRQWRQAPLRRERRFIAALAAHQRVDADLANMTGPATSPIALGAWLQSQYGRRRLMRRATPWSARWCSSTSRSAPVGRSSSSP